MKTGPERELVLRYWARLELGARGVGLTGAELREIEESRARRAEDRKSEEAQALLALVPPGARLVALDERGKSLTSPAFAADMAKARDGAASAYVLVIGGPDGLDDTVRKAAALTLNFGALTWPHQIVRVLAAEQLYRATTILAGHPYHRV